MQVQLQELETTMDGYGLNPTGANGASAPLQQPSLWDNYVQKIQNLHPLNSLLGQSGNQLGQRSINLFHGDGFRTDAQVYPPLPLPPATRPMSRPSVPGGAAASGTQQPQPQVAPLQNPQASGVGQGGVRGYAHALADNLGVASIAHQVAHPIQAMTEMQQQATADQHPFQTALKRATIDNPMLGVPELRGLAGTAKNSLIETGQAFNDLGITPWGYQTPQYGPNYAGAGVHALRAIPVLGTGLEKGMEYASQNGMGDPGNSYWQNVGKVWSSPKAMGTLTGMALQAAPFVAGGIRTVGLSRPLAATEDAISGRFGRSSLGDEDGLQPNRISTPMQSVAHLTPHLLGGGITSEQSEVPPQRFGAVLDPDTAATVRLLEPNLTPEEISNLLKEAPYRTQQVDGVSGPIVNRYIGKLNAGEVAPAIKVDGDVIVGGNHRAAAGYIQGTRPAEIGGRLDPTKTTTFPLEQIKVSPIDRDNNFNPPNPKVPKA
jgi:hypothetical protein